MAPETPPLLTDRAALARQRARADLAAASFLHDEAAAQVQERLEEVNRTFTAPAIVTGHPALWAPLLPGAKVVADEAVLDLAPGAHDLVVHAMALHWADDPVGQLVQARRALRPDGLFLAVFPAGQTLHELRAVLAAAEAEVSGGLSPRVVPTGDIRDLGGLLQRAGFALPVADVAPLAVTYADALALMRDLRAMGETNAMAARRRNFTRRALVARASTLYAEAFPADGGRIRATFELVFLTGWAPDESQQKPLRPGSARARLAEALGVPERPVAPRRD
ncbi:methyltransferase domain-containing protein [Oceaniglobus roseus]|uniref:methyltransferase domain-containing protein n=1 Tax=Oceaniglobus roseus TaxID=1737570 RepID=UPI000C7F3263|nr:methyltransferase domain-containing protein [Kandeliimicrobium roseum]